MKRTPTIRVDDHEWLCLMEIPSLLANSLHTKEESIVATARKIGIALEEWVSEGRLHPLEPETLHPWDHQTGAVPGYFILDRGEVESFAQAHGVALTRTAPKVIPISDRIAMISVCRAKELIVDAADCPDEICEDGMTALEAFAESVEEDFLPICEELDIGLFSSHNKKVAIERVGDDVDGHLMSKDSFVRYASYYGIEVDTPSEGGADENESRSTHIPSSIVTHTLTTKERTHHLEHIINLAQNNALERWNRHSVWAELIKLANSLPPPSPLIGFAQEEGVKYHKSDGVNVGFFSKNAIEKYLKRRHPRSSLKRD